MDILFLYASFHSFYGNAMFIFIYQYVFFVTYYVTDIDKNIRNYILWGEKMCKRKWVALSV